MRKISTKHILYKNVCSSCTTPMYINHVHQHHAMCQKISSMECINHMPLSICQPCSSTNMPTMCIYQYANHVHLSIFPPCPYTTMSTMCIYQHAKPCVISLMICLHHEPSIITMYQTNTNCCANQVIPMMQYHQAYAIYKCTKHVYHHALVRQSDESHTCNPIHVCQILHKTCTNQLSSRCLYQCTRNVLIMHQLQIINDVQHDHFIKSPTACPKMQSIHMPNACIMFFQQVSFQ